MKEVKEGWRDKALMVTADHSMGLLAEEVL